MFEFKFKPSDLQCGILMTLLACAKPDSAKTVIWRDIN